MGGISEGTTKKHVLLHVGSPKKENENFLLTVDDEGMMKVCKYI